MENETQMTQIKQSLVFSGKGTDFAFLMFKNLILTIFTLGIYAAWGRTNNRRYVWGHVSFLGDRATYTGQGIELFKGWIKLIVLYFILAIGFELLQKISILFAFALIPVYIYFYALFLYTGTRYKLSKTQWRGVNFGVEKNKKLTRQFIFLAFKNVGLTIISLGFHLPYQIINLKKFIVDRSHFGNLHFNYTGKGSEFFKIYAKGIILTILTLGIYSIWFIRDVQKYHLEHTKIGNIQFTFNLRAKDYFIYSISSYVLTLVTLGLALPWLINWGNNLFINAVEVFGSVDFNSINNTSTENADAIGDVASVDYDIDLGF